MRVLGVSLVTAIIFVLIGYFIGANYPNVAKRVTATVTG